MENPMAMVKLNSTEDLRPGMVISIGDAIEAIILFILNDEDIWVEKLDNDRVLH